MEGSGKTRICRLLLLLLLRPTKAIGADEIAEADKPIPVSSVDGVLGHRVKLPCDARVPSRDDKLQMVLWFRDKDVEPIYRYDVRDKAHSDAKRWSEIGDRVYFQVMSEPAHLAIQDLQMRDEGVYRCRVDFKNSPTRNQRINLTIVVPPDKPVIFDESGNIASSIIGPYNEGSNLGLSCQVTGGRPRPKLSWWLESEMLQDRSFERNGVVVNRLEFTQLQRHHLNRRLVCQASNTNQTVPQIAVAVLNLNLRPLSAAISAKSTGLLAEKRVDIECVTFGSRPVATITWWKSTRQIKKPTQNPQTEDKNVTRSLLSFVPTIEDDGKFLTCRSENPWIPGSAVEDRWKLNVHYPPRVNLQLGSNMNAEDIKEGDDVYFECAVKANPPYKRLSWTHEGRELKPGSPIAQKVITNTNTGLVLQKINRHAGGSYTCSAANDEGWSQSNVVLLRVKYVPTCKFAGEELIGAMRHETVRVKCEMAADPPNVQFHWTYNNSGIEVTHVSQSRYLNNGTGSWLNYTPTNDLDYGTLACWGSNKIGNGHRPCLFQIVSAGRPYTPKNCTVFNQTADSLSISCIESFNGGLPQHFNLEVYDTNAKKLELNISSMSPLFVVEGMESGVSLSFFVHAVNAKGRSDPFILDGITLRGVAKFIGGGSSNAEVNPVFGILVGCAIVLIILLVVSMIAIWKRSRRKKPPVAKNNKRNNENTFQAVGLTPTKIEQNGLDEIGNPDVIPNKNERSMGLRGFIRIHKTPPARRRKKDMEVKNKGETVALTQAQDQELQRNHNHSLPNNQILTTSSHNQMPPTRESRI